jgi:hypothetical protein
MVATVIMQTPPGCVAPAVAGLTERAAAARLHAAGCRVAVRGAALKQPAVQTVARQTPRAGSRTAGVVLWVNPLCVRSAAAGPPHDQGRRRGPTELITGLFIEGGPAVVFSAPGCRYPPGRPTAGTIQVLDPATGAVVRSRTIHRGRYLTFRLAPGRYLVRGRLGHQSTTQPATVGIRPGFTTRRYVVEDVP